MNHIIEKQLIIISVNFATAPSQMDVPINLRFAANELVLKSISYNNVGAADTADMIQIWCNLTNDNLIGAFPNDTAILQELNTRLLLNNTFQIGNMRLQFQQTSGGATFNVNNIINPQPLIAKNTNTKGIGVFTFEFLKTN